MAASVSHPLVKLTRDEFPIIIALNYATTTCITLRRFDDAEAINTDCITVYGRLLPTLVCRYAVRLAAGNLDAVGSMRALSEVFTPEELAVPSINLIRLVLIVNGLGKLPGYERQTAAAITELQALSEDPTQDEAVQARAAALVAGAGHSRSRAA